MLKMLLPIVILLISSCSSALDLCSGPNGKLTLESPSGAFIGKIPENTVLLHAEEFYVFKCESGQADFLTQISVKQIRKRENEEKYSLGSYEFNATAQDYFAFRNGANTKKVPVICHGVTLDICKVDVILVDQPRQSECTLKNDVSQCNVTDWNERINSRKDAEFFPAAFPEGRIRGNANKSAPKQKSFNKPVIKYSFFDTESKEWIYCDEYDGNGVKVSAVSHGSEDSTQTIACPIEFTNSASTAIIIRIEKTQKSLFSAAFPVQNESDPPKPEYTYFSVVVDGALSTEDLNIDEDGEENNLIAIILGFSVAIVIIVLGVIAVFILRKRRKSSDKKNNTKFYQDVKLVKSKEDEDDFSDVASMRTESTTATSQGDYYWDALRFDPDRVSKMDKAKLRSILNRQLSGDPSRINPDLDLNLQANCLAYNPKLEIDRVNFTIGKLLGSGHFGSVYAGDATGILHPGSLTKVAVKTVNDALDMSQLGALLCELKILANLDLHLNLVNLLGACTSEMADEGKLWLLLEYCQHGDLKSFLTSKNQIDKRCFVRWAYDVAKGMSYLSSKKIMHGDLACRNILISGSDHVAKVGDFGLSKRMYDSTRYKKEKRNYVPWKWMALEFLTDGSFTLQSDIWSYAVVLWEIFSVGREPYSLGETAGEGVETVVKKIINGYRMSLPDEADDEAADVVYEEIMNLAWKANPAERISFNQIVEVLEKKLLSSEETSDRAGKSAEYASLAALMFDDVTVSKRNTLSLSNSLDVTNPPAPPGSYQKMASVSSKEYITVQEAAKKANSHYLSVQEANNSKQPVKNNGYISVQMAQSEEEQQPQSSYITIEAAKKC